MNEEAQSRLMVACKLGKLKDAQKAITDGADLKIQGLVDKQEVTLNGTKTIARVYAVPALVALQAYRRFKTDETKALFQELMQKENFLTDDVISVNINEMKINAKGAEYCSAKNNYQYTMEDYIDICRGRLDGKPGAMFLNKMITQDRSILVSLLRRETVFANGSRQEQPKARVSSRFTFETMVQAKQNVGKE